MRNIDEDAKNVVLTLPSPLFTLVHEAEEMTAAAMSQSRVVKAAQAPATMNGKVQCAKSDKKVQIETKSAKPTLPLL